MTDSAIVYSRATNAEDAAREITDGIARGLAGQQPDAIVIFASPRYDQPALLARIRDVCKPKAMIGSSSAGEFTQDTRGEGLVCALALRSDDMQFAAGIGRGVSNDRARAARELVSTFHGASSNLAFRSALVMTDALAGHADDLVEQLTLATAGKYQFFGGGAGDDAQFRRTHVFFGAEALTDAVVGLEILSKKPLGIGVGHGWQPASPPLRVTEANGMTIVSLNGAPAVEAFEAHARELGQPFDRAAPLPFFLHNILGIDTGNGHKLRVPLAVGSDGSIACASEIPEGAKVNIMKTTSDSAVEAAQRATSSAVAALGGAKPKVALFFDCVATRLRMGDAFGLELEALSKLLDPAAYVGCNTHGQIARADGQFGGFHNCTAVVCILPE